MQWVRIDILDYKKSFYLWASNVAQAMFFASRIMEEEIKKARRDGRALKKIRLRRGRASSKKFPFTTKPQELLAWDALNKNSPTAFILKEGKLEEVSIPFPKSKERAL